MKRLGIALAGCLVGCLIGYLLPLLIYPWQTFQFSSVGAEPTGEVFQFFGLCLGGAAGFWLGSWWAARNLPAPPRPAPEPLPPADPHKVIDNLD